VGRARTGALAAAGIVLLALGGAGPWLAPSDPLHSIDSAALRLLPPGTVVPALIRSDGKQLPVAGRDSDRPGTLITEWRAEGDDVVYRRGPRWKSVPLEELQRDEAGRPRVIRLAFPLGTDRLGRDLLSRLLTGARLSLGIGIFGVAGATLLGGLIGLVAGLGGRLSDAVLGRIGDSILSVPRIVLVMALAVLIRPGPWVLALLLAVSGWPSLARLVRADVRSLSGSEMVASARAAGAERWRVAFRHVLPHALTTLVVAAGLRVGPFILLEGSLSFLGFGVPPPHPSWGNILGEGRDVLIDGWWITAVPGLLLGLTVVVVNAAADGLRDLMEPRRRPA